MERTVKSPAKTADSRIRKRIRDAVTATIRRRNTSKSEKTKAGLDLTQ